MKNIISLLAVISALFVGCIESNKSELQLSSDEDFEIRDTNVIIGFKEKEIQSFQLSVNNSCEIEGENGTLISFSKNCFEFSGDSIKIHLIECYSIQSMLNNQLVTQTTNGTTLETDGMIYLCALSENGDTLLLKEDANVEVKMPTIRRKKGIEIFSGNEQDDYVVWNTTNVSLVPIEKGNQDNLEAPTIGQAAAPTSSPDSIWKNEEPINSSNGINLDDKIKDNNLLVYSFQISQLGWINCDRYLEGETQELMVTIDEKDKSAVYYMILKESNSIVVNSSTTKDHLSFNNIPIGQGVIIVGLRKKNGKLFFGIESFDNNEQILIMNKLKETSRDDVVSILLEYFGTDIWNRPIV